MIVRYEYKLYVKWEYKVTIWNSTDVASVIKVDLIKIRRFNMRGLLTFNTLAGGNPYHKIVLFDFLILYVLFFKTNKKDNNLFYC